MTDYLTDNEQIGLIKDWWKKYGNLLVIAVLLIVTVIFAGRWWQQHRSSVLTRASIEYGQLLFYMADENIEETQAQAQQLIDDSPQTVYSQLAAFILARQAVYRGDLARAAEPLNWVIDHSHNLVMQQIARIRLARVLLEQGEQTQGLSILAVVNDDTYIPLIDEIKGDIYASQQQWDGARQAYISALSELTALGVNDQILQMKLSNLPSDVQ